MKKPKIGLFGGSFNPPHRGHFEKANYLINYNIVDEVWFIPSYNPLKSGSDYVSSEHRINMLEIEARKEDKFKVITEDKWISKPVYAVDLISDLKIQYPDYDFYWIMGSDCLYTLPKWKNWQSLCNDPILNVIVFQRPGYLPIACPEEVLKIIRQNIDNYIFINDIPSEISSSEVREDIKNAKTQVDEGQIEYLIGWDILNYIKNNKLYGINLPNPGVWNNRIIKRLKEIKGITKYYLNGSGPTIEKGSDDLQELEEVVDKWIERLEKYNE